MSTKTVTTRIQLWNKTTSGWESKNPVLLKGEFGFDSDKKYIKIGDGVTAWNSLPSVRLPKECIDGFADENTKYDIREDVAGKKFTLLSSDGVNPWGDVRSFTCHDWTTDIATAKADAIGTAETDATTKALSAVGVAKAYTDELADDVGTRIFDLDSRLSSVEDDYLKAEDKTELEALIANEADRAIEREDELSDMVGAEYARAMLAEDLLDTRISAIEADYLTVSDKTELAGSITAEATRAATEESALDGRLDAIEADYLKAADKTALETSIAGKVSQTSYDTKMSELDTSIAGKVSQTSYDTKMSELDTAIAGKASSTDLTSATNRITAIEGKIPNEATSDNKLADKAFVNSSIATATATFKGTYGTIAEIEALEADANDYAFLSSVDTAGNTKFDRYKFAGATETWLYEYTLNNSSFTAAQWGTINSGATADNIAQIATNTDAIGTLNTDVSEIESDYLSRSSGGTVVGQLKANTSLKVIDSVQASPVPGLVGAAQTTVTVGLNAIQREYTPAPSASGDPSTDYSYAYPSKSGTLAVTDDITTAIADKADKATSLAGYGITDAYTKTETGTAIADAINGLDVAAITGSTSKTITSISETNGKIDATYSDIQIAESQVTGLTTALAGKAAVATTLAGYGIGNAYTKTETDTAITNAIGALDVAAITGTTAKTITSISETDGKIAATYSNIAIAESQVTNLTTDLGNKLATATYNARITSMKNALSAITDNEDADLVTVNNALRMLKAALS